MSKPFPSQYDCDNMEPGDVIHIKNRLFLYRFFRKHFLRNKIQIRVRKSWNSENLEYNSYYQEDCTLVYKYEMACIKKERVVGKRRRIITVEKDFDVSVDLDNIYISEDNGSITSIPIQAVSRLMESSKESLMLVNRESLVKQAIKSCKYNGAYFRKYVSNNNIKTWNMMYCSVCGNPLTLIFNEHNIHIENKCICGNLHHVLEDMSYDDFAITYYSQTSSNARKVYDEFWMKEV